MTTTSASGARSFPPKERATRRLARDGNARAPRGDERHGDRHRIAAPPEGGVRERARISSNSIYTAASGPKTQFDRTILVGRARSGERDEAVVHPHERERILAAILDELLSRVPALRLR